MCYFHALQKGDINKVVPIDKSSTVLTILLAIILFNEQVSLLKIISIVLIGVSTLLMISKQTVENKDEETSRSWLFYAILSAVFASLTAILGKIGIDGVDSNLGTAIRTFIVLIMSWIMVFVTHKSKQVRQIDKRELLFIILSGFATGASWLFYYRALQEGITSIVVSIDKLSILVTIIFSWFVFQEKLSKKSFFGLLGIVVGTLLLVFS